MYEKAGLSSLERLVGREVSAICFVRDYVQVMFDGLVFTCYTLPRICISGESASPHMPGYKDKLCQLIGRPVQSVVETSEVELSLWFDNGDSLAVSLRLEDQTSVEAAMLHEEHGEIFDVWRCGD